MSIAHRTADALVPATRLGLCLLVLFYSTVRVHGGTFPVLPPPLGHMTQLVFPFIAVPHSFATLAMRK
jgi:hypothetical protein